MNLDFLAIPMGKLVKLIYDMVSVVDSKYLSAYAISIIISTILFKLVVLPLTLKQTKSMKKMQEMNPKIQELQEKREVNCVSIGEYVIIPKELFYDYLKLKYEKNK